MLKAMRVIVLERMNTMRKLLESWSEDICPNIHKRLEVTKDQHRFWHVIPTGGNLFEVWNGSQAFRVDEEHRTCTCRLWQLLILPCAHAIAVIFKLNRRVEDYVPGCFRKQSFYSAYHQYLTPVGGMDFWPDSTEMSRVLPPKPKKMPGRPRKKRIRAAHENKNTSRVSRSGITMTCQNCFQKGQNKKGCKNPTVVLPPKPPTKKGRPRKEQVGVSSLLDEDLVYAPVDSAPVDVIAQNIQNAPNVETAATQSSPNITPHVVVPDISPRPRSQRILNKKLAKNPTGIGSSNSNSIHLE